MTDTPNRPPLWWAMQDAGSNAPGTPRDAIAAEIRALRDWLVPEPEEPGFTATDEAFAIWEERKALRALLTAEADRAAELLQQQHPAPTPPVEGEVGELVADELVRRLRTKAATEKSNRCHYSAILLTRAADILEQRHPAPVPISERLPVDAEQALIKAECALADIAEGEPEENAGDSDDLLQWAEQRAATALSRIRPVMRLHGILTSEYPPLPATALPLPQQETPND